MSPPPLPYRAAIIGTGRIASLLERDPLRTRPHTHAGWYTAEPRTTLVAGCDVDAGRLQAFADDWTIAPAHLHADYRTLLSQERPDIVSICAYAADRVAMSRAAVAAGARGLWIEKAVGCSVDEAEHLARDVAAAGTVAVVDHPRRLQSRYRSVARWIEEGTFGRLESIHVVFSGHVIHTGTHAWDLLLAWCGPWARVDASLDTPEREAAARGDHHQRDEADQVRYAEALRGGVADRGARVHIVFANGVEAFVTGGAKQYFIFQCDLVSTGGRVQIGNDVWQTLTPADSPHYTGYRELAAADPATYVHDEDKLQTSVLADLLDAIENRTTPVSSLDAAIQALALGIAVMQAGLTGRTVTPATLDRSLRITSV